jgi:hypothetical protein
VRKSGVLLERGRGGKDLFSGEVGGLGKGLLPMQLYPVLRFTTREGIASMASPQTLSWSSDGKPLKSWNVRGASAIVFVDCDNSSKDSRIEKWENVNENGGVSGVGNYFEVGVIAFFRGCLCSNCSICSHELQSLHSRKAPTC